MSNRITFVIFGGGVYYYLDIFMDLSYSSYVASVKYGIGLILLFQSQFY
jgi:hypothetical protein